MLQQGTLNHAGYIQPIYQATAAGQQQVLLSPAGGLTIQQQLSQGQITVMTGPGTQPQAQGTPQKMAQDSQGKPVIAGMAAGQPNKGVQVMTSQGGAVTNVAGKMTMAGGIVAGMTAAHKGSAQQTAGQIVTNVAPQTQFVTQSGANGQALVFSPLGMTITNAQGGMVGSAGGVLQATQTAQGPITKTGPSPQPQTAHKFIPAGQQQQKTATAPQQPQLQLAGLPPGAQYRQINSTTGQQLVASQVGVGQVGTVGQPVIGQAQTILGPLQTLNAFGPGISWTGPLSGQPILQPSILIRNQHDGSVYIQQQQPQQQHQLQQTASTTPVQVQAQQLQTTAAPVSSEKGSILNSQI